MTMADQVRRILPNLIRLEPVDNRLVAHLLGLSPRAMARRLADEKTTLHELIDEARFEVAQQLLRDTDIGITEVAAALYYSDASAFSRAFRRKLSVSPAAWRKAQHKS
jgi:AraC-like DNA-binding protein